LDLEIFAPLLHVLLWSTLKHYGENVTCASLRTQFGLLPP